MWWHVVIFLANLHLIWHARRVCVMILLHPICTFCRLGFNENGCCANLWSIIVGHCRSKLLIPCQTRNQTWRFGSHRWPLTSLMHLWSLSFLACWQFYICAKGIARWWRPRWLLNLLPLNLLFLSSDLSIAILCNSYPLKNTSPHTKLPARLSSFFRWTCWTSLHWLVVAITTYYQSEYNDLVSIPTLKWSPHVLRALAM